MMKGFKYACFSVLSLALLSACSMDQSSESSMGNQPTRNQHACAVFARRLVELCQPRWHQFAAWRFVCQLVVLLYDPRQHLGFLNYFNDCDCCFPAIFDSEKGSNKCNFLKRLKKNIPSY